MSGLLLAAPSGCIDNPYIVARVARDAAQDDNVGDSGTGAGASSCDALSGALACSDFEAIDLSDWPMTFTSDGASVARTTDRSASGMGALHATTSARDQTAVVAQPLASQTTGTLHLRAMVFIPAGPETNTINLFFLGFDPNPVEEPPAPFIGLDFNLDADAVQVYSPQNFPDRVTGDVQVPRDRWFCLTAQVRVADPDGSVAVQIDGAPALSVDPFVTLPDGGIVLFRAGIDWSSGQEGPFEVFMDDVALATAPLACP